MTETRGIRARVPEALESAARARAPELAELDMSTLVRVGLIVLASPRTSLVDAIAEARRRPGPLPGSPRPPHRTLAARSRTR